MMHPFQQTYTEELLVYRNFIDIDQQGLINILSWRNRVEVRKWMKSVEEIPIEQHLKYCAELKDKTDRGHWVIEENGRALGVININQYFEVDNSCEWGFYLNPVYTMGDTMLKVFYYSQHLLFDYLNTHRLIGKVKLDNKGAILLNDFLGMREVDKEIIDNSLYSLREQFKEDWTNKRPNIEGLSGAFVTYILSIRNNKNHV
ncbi:MAG: GNAT family N-acetyltransferase [Saprospiraceae bacterium]|nr:GNAT family N-acetyltransferase [Saprospiraceae bacterium]